MTKALFYKEWIKTRWYLLLATLILAIITGYCMLRIDRILDLKEMPEVWGAIILKDTTFIDLLEYFPLLAGVLLAAVQFFPEIHRKCLKLTLHLPYSQSKMIFTMLCYGICVLLACFLISMIIMGIYLPQHFTSSMVRHIILTSLPWYLAGFAGYLLLSWIILEPTWKRRIVNLIISVLLLRVFFLANTAEAYNAFLPWLTILTLLTSTLTWISIVRFKIGKQD